jgi:cation transport ATPase
MDEIKELEKYKELLDSGAISEEEFKRLKQKLLGLKTDEEKEAERAREREAALAEIEKMRNAENAKKAQELLQEQESKEQQRKKDEEAQAQIAYAEEKAKEKARLEALAEEEERRWKAEQIAKKETTKKVSRVAVAILLWLVTFFCLLMVIGYFGGVSGSKVADCMAGIIFLILAIMACPYVTKTTRDIPQLSVYYRFKKIIVIALVVILFIIIAAVPA